MMSYDLTALADVYYSSYKTRHAYRQVLWRMTVEDAQKVCDHPSTCHPGNWMMCWTAHSLVEAKPMCFVSDDGRFDALFAELGVTVRMSRQMLIDGTAVDHPVFDAPCQDHPRRNPDAVSDGGATGNAGAVSDSGSERDAPEAVLEGVTP